MAEREGHMARDSIQSIPIAQIFLDEENPRLPENARRDQKEMTLYIARNTSITELMTAIASRMTNAARARLDQRHEILNDQQSPPPKSSTWYWQQKLRAV